MGATLRGYITCDTCHRTVTVVAEVSTRDGVELWWELPEKWELYGKNRGRMSAYCSSKCRSAVKNIGQSWPDQTGKARVRADAFDADTVGKVFELIEAGAGSASADQILAAIEAVLIAWRKGTPTNA